MRAVGTWGSSGGILIGLGAAFALIILVVLQSVTPNGLLGMRTEMATATPI